MALNMKLQLRQSQQLIMTPQLRQAIKILQLSRVELQKMVDTALVENPVLEETQTEDTDQENVNLEDTGTDEEHAAGEEGGMIENERHIENDAEWREYINAGAGSVTERSGMRPDNPDTNLEATLVGDESLHDHLYWQLEMSSLSPLEMRIGQAVIGTLDDDGYLSMSLLEILQDMAEEESDLHQTAANSLKNNHLVLALPQKMDLSLLSLRREGPLQSFGEEDGAPKKRGRKKKQDPLQAKTSAATPAKPRAQEDTQQAKGDASTLVTKPICQIAEAVLRFVQQFDPLGVGARSMQECLDIQLRALGLNDQLPHVLVTKHLKLLERRDLERAARKTKTTEEEVIEAYKLILSLEPTPGRPFGRGRAQTVIPDVYLLRAPSGLSGGEDQIGQYKISLNESGIPRLKISHYYQKIAQVQAQTPSNGDRTNLTQEYIQEKIRAGNWLMKSIEQRQKTILKVAKSIVKHQYNFFDLGPSHLKPLVLKDVAEDIEAHESTVSRITTSKYIHTPRGVFELKYFFASGIDQGFGEVVSSKKIKDMISKIVAQEPPKKPLTDIQIAEILSGESKIKVARRTVAKYREALNILPSNRRKRPF